MEFYYDSRNATLRTRSEIERSIRESENFEYLFAEYVNSNYKASEILDMFTTHDATYSNREEFIEDFIYDEIECNEDLLYCNLSDDVIEEIIQNF